MFYNVSFMIYSIRKEDGSDYSCRTESTPYSQLECHVRAQRALGWDYLLTSAMLLLLFT